ncbi:MAG TPA: hypothetical protein VGI95_19720 [Caulobacteraceae bacterium]
MISRIEQFEGHLMGWQAIGLILLFVVSFLVLNRYEFGRFD